MNLPDFITAHAPTLSLIVRAKLSNELPGTSYDDAWDALESPEDYAPGPEIEAWMRENWHGVIFGAQPQPDSEEDSEISARLRTRTLARMWMRPFLDAFIDSGIATDACRECIPNGIHDSTPEKAEKRDKVFAEEYAIARKIVADKWRKAGKNRAIDGVLEPIIGRIGKDEDGHLRGKDGELLYRRVYSDSILNRGLAAYCHEFKAKDATTVNVNASASASASSSSTSVAMSAEEIEKLQARKQRQLEKQAARNERLQMSKAGNN